MICIYLLCIFFRTGDCLYDYIEKSINIGNNISHYKRELFTLSSNISNLLTNRYDISFEWNSIFNYLLVLSFLFFLLLEN